MDIAIVLILDFTSMKYKNFPQEFWQQFENTLEQELKNNPKPDLKPIAAFDADGTLWDTDLGENFFKWQIANSGLKLPANPWEHYRREKEEGDTRKAYLWLAQINAGQSIAKVRQWAKSAMGSPPLFADMQKLIQKLKAKGVEVFVITASVKWAVEPGAELYGIDHDHVLGIQTEIDSQGLVQSTQKGFITWREGKPAALLDRTGNRPAFLCGGNTMGDFALLESATRLRIAVGAAPEGHELWETEEKLRSESLKRGWFSHRF
jgi:HAD superfamily phosphoserine phosphatase-like hydrolase